MKTHHELGNADGNHGAAEEEEDEREDVEEARDARLGRCRRGGSLARAGGGGAASGVGEDLRAAGRGRGEHLLGLDAIWPNEIVKGIDVGGAVLVEGEGDRIDGDDGDGGAAAAAVGSVRVRLRHLVVEPRDASDVLRAEDVGFFVASAVLIAVRIENGRGGCRVQSALLLDVVGEVDRLEAVHAGQRRDEAAHALFAADDARPHRLRRLRIHLRFLLLLLLGAARGRQAVVHDVVRADEPLLRHFDPTNNGDPDDDGEENHGDGRGNYKQGRDIALAKLSEEHVEEGVDARVRGSGGCEPRRVGRSQRGLPDRAEHGGENLGQVHCDGD